MRPGAPRRGTAWDDELISAQVANGAQDARLVIQNVADPEKRGCTLVRVIVHLWLQASAPGASNGTMSLDIGVCLVSDDAFAAGALPEADVAADFPVAGWVYRDRICVLDSVDAKDGPLVEVFKDLRVQRKLDRSSAVLLLEANSRLGTAFDVSCMGIVRGLYKLP